MEVKPHKGRGPHEPLPHDIQNPDIPDVGCGDCGKPKAETATPKKVSLNKKNVIKSIDGLKA